jgi:microsomal dipeptidase-like Zn-dependent dipeptidase
LVIDGHVDVAGQGVAFTFPLDQALAGGLAAAVVPARAGRIPRSASPDAGLSELDATHKAVLDAIEQSRGNAELATTPQDVGTNAAKGVFSFILGFQNARPLTGLADIQRWVDQGVSIFDFGFIGDNQWVKSARPYPSANVGGEFDGISDSTVRAIELLNARGVIVDTAQVSVRARQRIVEASRAPVLASHNGLRAQAGQADRTIADHEIRLIAERGGVVQLVAFDGYLTARGDDPKVVADVRELRERFGLPGFRGPQDYYAVLDPETASWDEEKFAAYFAEYHAKVRHGWPRSDVERLADAVDHVIALVGVDHVGVASDFNHGGGIAGWLDHAQTPGLVAALRRRHGDQDVARILGGNLLRLWGDVREAASR